MSVHPRGPASVACTPELWGMACGRCGSGQGTRGCILKREAHNQKRQKEVCDPQIVNGGVRCCALCRNVPPPPPRAVLKGRDFFFC